jgi:hypothetical protein
MNKSFRFKSTIYRLINTEKQNPSVSSTLALPLFKAFILLESLGYCAENQMVPNHLSNTHLKLTQAVD